MTDKLHPRERFHKELNEMRDNVLRLSHMTDSAIQRSMQALVERDDELAQQVIRDDKPINRLRYEIEEDAYKLIATQQPLARDLRSIVTAIHLVVELERIADHAANIAKIAVNLNKVPLLKPLIDLPRMASITSEMLGEAVDTYLNWDIDQAHAIKAHDKEVDALHEQVYRELLSFMIQDPKNIERATLLLSVSHDVERMADRVKNICERVIFMITGTVRAKDQKKEYRAEQEANNTDDTDDDDG